MGYDHGDSFPFDFEPNGIPFGSKSRGKLSPRSYPVQCERKCSFLSVRETHRKNNGYIYLNNVNKRTIATQNNGMDSK